MEFGFCEFADKNDKIVKKLLKTSNNKNDPFGLKAINDNIAEEIFPECSTWMPNLVYMYYFNAMCHVLRENKVIKKNKSEWYRQRKLKDWVALYEKVLSEWIKNCDISKDNGFTSQELYNSYITKMEYLEFFDEDFDNESENRLSKLKETERFKFIKEVIEGTIHQDGSTPERKDILYKLEEKGKNKKWVGKLEREEKVDYIIRVLNKSKNKSSLTAEIIKTVLEYKSSPQLTYLTSENISGKLDDAIKKEKINDIRVKFNELKIVTTDKEKVKLSRIQMYSLVQRAIKCIYYTMITEKEIGKKYEEEREKIFKLIGKNPSNITEKTIKEEASRKFIKDILGKIRKYCEDEKKEVLEEIKKKIREREEEIQGRHSNIGIKLPEENLPNNYIDTFHWQYRPKDEKETPQFCIQYYLCEIFEKDE